MYTATHIEYSIKRLAMLLLRNKKTASCQTMSINMQLSTLLSGTMEHVEDDDADDHLFLFDDQRPSSMNEATARTKYTTMVTDPETFKLVIAKQENKQEMNFDADEIALSSVTFSLQKPPVVCKDGNDHETTSPKWRQWIIEVSTSMRSYSQKPINRLTPNTRFSQTWQEDRLLLQAVRQCSHPVKWIEVTENTQECKKS
jgi:hypothetical protein